ncbi:hypothetical protein ACH4MN_31990 [Streptomyces anulatus]|uniref:hypothetical protein n=1 Tax=Streptomyces sp. C3-3 TaxID=2824901 RepID=UPI001B36D629|nr:hypothetical protein [Streptomyces sp. C3-3]MBQ1116424.1 hypothetical protein [Streptomyces sp. C3-3]
MLRSEVARTGWSGADVGQDLGQEGAALSVRAAGHRVTAVLGVGQDVERGVGGG